MKVVFLDRDGVINANRPEHVRVWEEFRFLPGALDALRLLREEGWRVFVVTNQAIIGRGMVAQETVAEIHRRMCEEVVRHGGYIEAVFLCPHRPEEACGCRKPRIGLLLQAATRYELPLEQCYLVGDALTDIAAGNSAGCSCVLVESGRWQREQGIKVHCGPWADHVALHLPAAVAWMRQEERLRACLPTYVLSDRTQVREHAYN